MAANALTAVGAKQKTFNRNGLVAFALPPAQINRVSSQQGAFLFNAADRLTFEESMFAMMKGHPVGEWCSVLHIPSRLLPEVERRLYQLNIHELSLFPDIEGLAGLIRQNIRLRWGPR